MRVENNITAYELIGILSKYPADMPVAVSVIAERIVPLNAYADGSVDIDELFRTPEITVQEIKYGAKEYVRLEVALT